MTEETRYSQFTDEMIERARSRIGTERVYHNPWHGEATKDAIRHFAWGIGDPNPLWWQAEYASKTRYGTVIAPPLFLFSTSCGPLWHPGTRSRGAGLPGIHGLYAGDSWEWHRPIQLGDVITAKRFVKDLVEKRSRYSDRMFLRTEETDYYDADGGIIGKCLTHNLSMERGRPQEKGKYADALPWRWTDEELQKVGEDYDNEEVRGATPRYWEDVNEGDSIGYVVKGPLTIMSLVAWWQGRGGIFVMTDKIWHLYRKAHPSAGWRDPETNIMDVPDRTHFEPRAAQQIGFPAGGYDIGPQRECWYGSLMTNWMGDDGFLARLEVTFRRPNWMGDATWIRGKIARKYQEGGDHYVDCELWGDNQRGDRHSSGAATAILPTRTRPDYSPGASRMKRSS